MPSERLEAVLDLCRGPSVLHVGCTGGLQTAVPAVDSDEWAHGVLLERFPDAWGIDISPDKVQHLRAAGVPNIFVGDAQDMHFDQRFDTVLAGELIEHLRRPADFMTAAKSVLAPGGRLVLSTPYAFALSNILYGWVKYPRTCGNPEHTVWLCPQTLSTLANMSGLRIESLSLVFDFPDVGGRYGIGAKLYRFLARVLPRRMVANCMVAVLVPREDHPHPNLLNLATAQ